MTTTKKGLLAVFLCAMSSVGTARAIDPTAGTGGAAFLQMGQGSARAQALGQSYVAMADGVDALTYNPAGLAATQQREVSYSYLRYIQDLSTPLYMGYAHPMGRTVWGANFAYMSANGFDTRNINGIPTPDTNVVVHDGYGSLALARAFWYEKLLLGGAVRIVHEDNGGNLHDTVVGDAGVIIKPNSTVSVAFAVQNIGAHVQDVASVVRGGVAYRWGDFLNLGLEISEAADTGARVGVGAEFIVPEEYLELGQVVFRVGYFNSDNLGQSFNGQLQGLHLDRASGVSFGFGLFTSQAFGYGLGIDYSFVPFGALGIVDQLTLKLKF